MGRFALYRDPIWGDIELDPFCVKLLEHEQLQRLGRISQLGFAQLVYRGATHTRLSHMIGTYAVAKRLFDEIENNHNRISLERLPIYPPGFDHPGEVLDKTFGKNPIDAWRTCRYIVSWAALLHDITHVPFGHTLEDEFWGLFAKHDSLVTPRNLILWGDGGLIEKAIKAIPHADFPPDFSNAFKNNRDLLFRLIRLIVLYREDPETFDQAIDKNYTRLKKALDGEKKVAKDRESEELKRLLGTRIKNIKDFLNQLDSDYKDLSEGRIFHPFMNDLIANTICADLLDYLKRDAVYSGLKLQYDERILKAFVLAKEGKTYRAALQIRDPRGVKRIDFIADALNLMRMRHDLALKIYYHKTKAAASTMLVMALKILKDVNITLKEGDPQDPDSILNPKMGDYGLLEWIYKHGEKLSQQGKYRHIGRAVKDLIDNLYNRKLYKTRIYIPFELWPKEDCSGEKIRILRTKALDISKSMADTVHVDSHKILLYVPPLKDKAKGLATRAIFREGQIKKLGDHPDIQEPLDQINKSFQSLWKMLLFVHPELYSNLEDYENIKLLSIIDELLLKILREEGVIL